MKDRQRRRNSAHLWTLELPGDSCHDIYGVGSSDSDADGTKTTTVWCVGICADKHDPRVGVVLEDDLFCLRNLNVTVFKS